MGLSQIGLVGTDMVHPDQPMTTCWADAGVNGAVEVAGVATRASRSVSAFEAVQAQGFASLRFPAELEAQFLDDKAAERLRMGQLGVVVLLLLSNIMLLADWLMIPDQFDMALILRLGLFTPLCLILLGVLRRIVRVDRNRAALGMSVVAALITSFLCQRSADPLAVPYMVCLSLILLFNGGVFRLRFWLALRVDVIVLLIYAGTIGLMPDPPWGLVASLSLVMVSTSVFTLYSSYWLEHEERSNWLMVQHEQVLLAELEQANRRLDQISRFDTLTELANRRHFDEFLQQLWSRAVQDGQHIALLIIDIDHFKLYNDHYGHPAGDACLKAVAAALKRHLRKPEDMVARLGGEEFIAVLSHTSLDEAVAVAQRVREGVALLALPHAGSLSHSAHVTVSIGVACAQPMAARLQATELVAAADAALYRAKSAGRNQVCAAAVEPAGEGAA
jgi:diguanylate cyclase (GGDEF)-like protein